MPLSSRGSIEIRACTSEGASDDDGTDAVKRGTQLLEVFALQILMHSRQRDKKKLRYVRKAPGKCEA